MYNGHLSIEEIEQLIQQKGPAENQSHVATCLECKSLLEDCQAISAKLEKLASIRIGADRAMKCPDERIWFDVAAGTLPDTESLEYIQHAAECLSCGRRLKTAVRMFEEELSPEEEQTLAQLPSPAAKVQRQLADDLAATKTENIQKRTDTIIRKRAGFTSWGWFSWAAGTAGLAVVVFSSLALYRQHELHQAEQEVAAAYQRGRPMEYRVAGVPYGIFDVEMGATRLRPHIEVPDTSKTAVLAAQAALLEGDSATAVRILENAQKEGNNSLLVLNNLVVAYAMEAVRTDSEQNFHAAIDLSEHIIDSYPSNPIAYFNRGLIFIWRKQIRDATEAFDEALSRETDADWQQEIKNKLKTLK